MFNNPTRSATEHEMGCGSLQKGHILRKSLWAMIAKTDELIKNGSMPIFSILTIDPAAVVVCKELNTKCPVKAALTAMSSVSASRISPIMMILGAWRRMERSEAGKVNPTDGL